MIAEINVFSVFTYTLSMTMMMMTRIYNNNNVFSFCF